jgi:hypothetical protein
MDTPARTGMLAAPRWATRADELLASRWLPWAIIAVGVLLRLAQYAANRSLWLDEAALALNIVERDYAGLLEPLDRRQTGPIGFLFLLRFAYEGLGGSEYALRLAPLAASLVAMVGLYPLARAYISPRAVPVALGLFAVLDPLIYYSSELKQYSTDMACTVLALYGAHLALARPGLIRLGLLGLAGVPLLWLSQPAAFVLGGAGLVLGVQALRARAWGRAGVLAAVGAVWLLNFAAAYQLALRTIADYSYFEQSWSNGFAPGAGGAFALEDLRWFVMTFYGVFKYPTGLEDYAAGIAAIAAVLAGAALARRRPLHLLLLTAPIALTLLASFMRRYPFQDRLLFFLVPVFLLLIAEGVELLSSAWRPRWALWLLIVFTLTVEPAGVSALNLVTGRRTEELRPALEELRARVEPGDTVYVYYGAQDAFDYYTLGRPLPVGEVVRGVRGREDWGRYLADLGALRGRERVWFVFSHVYDEGGVDERQLFLFELERSGEARDRIEVGTVSAHLYDLSGGN